MSSPYVITKKLNVSELTVLTDGLSNPAFIIVQCVQVGTKFFVNMYRHKINQSAHRAQAPHTVGVWRITYHSKNKNK